MFGYQLTKTPWYKRPRIQVGRGNSSGKGNYSGRWCKGQGQRAGNSVSPTFEGWQTPLVQRLPKLRGFKRNFKLVTKYQGINVSTLDKDVRVENGATITPEQLVLRGFAHKNDTIKIMGNGELSKKLTFSWISAFTASAKEKITSAGGTIA